MKNLFSVLTPEQINGMSPEDRRTLAELDKKLFPNIDGEGGGEEGLHNQEWVKNYLAKKEAQQKEEEYWSNKLQESFV